MMHYTCKYAPVELFAGFGVDCAPLDDISADGPGVEEASPANLCGFSRALACAVRAGQVEELVLTNCCDCLRRVYDLAKASGTCRFLHLLDVPHCADECATDRFARSLEKLRDAYSAYSGKVFSEAAFVAACRRASGVQDTHTAGEPYVALLGVRASKGLVAMAREALPLPVVDRTCLGSRDAWFGDVTDTAPDDAPDGKTDLRTYARALLTQTPCARMGDAASRRTITEDPDIRGIVYHSLRFCDWYGIEHARLKERGSVPTVQIESDYTRQGEEQLRTRLEAFGEQLAGAGFGLQEKEAFMPLEDGQLVAGIDSGSASTDVVIMDGQRRIVASAVLPTKGSATASAEASLAEALEQAGISRERIVGVVATGYGRDIVGEGKSVTEISCHALGAHFLNPEARTVIDIGGQDSKAIAIDEAGGVTGFAMNDKCAAGTGRFLEMMSRTLDVPLEQMSDLDLQSRNAVTISSTCTVFAESEVVSLVARDVALPDIVAGLCTSVASRTASLAKRVGVNDVVMMTGGVAKNGGVVRALENSLGCTVTIDERAQLCGAIGAALFALRG